MKKLIILAILVIWIFLSLKETYGYTPDQWIYLYQRDCQTVGENQACKQRLEETLSRAFSNRLMVLYYLKKYNIPPWLATVPIIESEYSSNAVSESGAVGLWQFMSHTAKEYGLKHRKDPVNSTKAACWYLKYLYVKYNDWKLALMAYNAGEKRIDNHLENKGEPLTFETLNYYPQLIAMKKIIDDIANGSEKYGFTPNPTKTRFKRYALYALFLK